MISNLQREVRESDHRRNRRDPFAKISEIFNRQGIRLTALLAAGCPPSQLNSHGAAHQTG